MKYEYGLTNFTFYVKFNVYRNIKYNFISFSYDRICEKDNYYYYHACLQMRKLKKLLVRTV